MWNVVADSTSSSLKISSFDGRNLENPILVLEIFVKSEALLALYTLKVLASYNVLSTV